MTAEPQVQDEDRGRRHRAAVANSLMWADEAARRGEYGEALSWVAVVEAAGHVLSGAYEAKRRAWQRALDADPAPVGR